MMMRLGFLVWSLMKVPLWQADTTTTVGSAPQPAVSARSNAAGLNRRSSGRRKKPRCSPWLVTKTKQASPPSVLSALRTLVDDDRRAPSLASSSLMSLTPSAARRSCNVSTPLAKAGLLLSPATSKACQRLAGMAPLAGSGTAASWAWVDGGGASSGVQPPTSKARTTAAATRTNISGCSPVAQFGLAPAERKAISA